MQCKKLHPSWLLNINNMISLWHVLTTNLLKQGHFGNSKDIPVSMSWEAHIKIF